MIQTSKLNVNCAFKGMDPSDAVREYAAKRAMKFVKHLDDLTTCDFVFHIEKASHVAQLHVVAGGFNASSEAQEENMYAAIDAVTDRIEQQTRKHKEKLKGHTGRAHHNSDGQE